MRQQSHLAAVHPELRLLDVLRDDGATRLLRVEHREAPDRRFLVKLRAGPPSPAKAVCLHTDHETLSRHRLACALPFVRLEGSGQEALLFFRDPGGSPLDPYADMPLEGLIELALGMVEAVDEIHRAGLIHRDLRPDVFLRSPHKVFVTDFSRAVKLTREHRDLQAVEADTAPLRYIAPELTGRLNRPVDYRADYYSLGAVLYELFTGRPPFAAEDPHELVYRHLAFSPESPASINANLPATLCDIVLRLLEKDPDRRYQRASELIDHLRVAREVVQGLRTDDVALISTLGVQRPLEVPHRLYGRDDERRRLLRSIDSAFAHRPQLLLISGPSGIGKTTLIRETYLPITRQRAFYVSGKFDQLQRGTPYSAWVAALEDLAEFMLAEPRDSLADWRNRLREALGPHAAVLGAMVPSMGTLLGDLPAPSELPPSEAKERLNEMFLRFFAMFRRADRPLVVFLDDLQWADDASLELLETLMNRLDRVPLLVIGAYRNEEVSRTHPLTLTLRAIDETSAFARNELRLEALKFDDVAALLAEGAQRAVPEVEELAAEVMRRTAGNPFFLWQFLRTMRDNGWLFIDSANSRWAWDLAAIRGAGFAEHVVDLMLHRFANLPPKTRQLLSWAACLGMEFELDVLCWLADTDVADVRRDLQPALLEEFVRPVGVPDLLHGQVVHRTFRFFHDRMQEAAYRSIPDDRVPALHHRIGNLLMERLQVREREARAIEIADHFNRARELISAPTAVLELARLNLAAARQAKASAAFSAGLEHIRLGMSRLSDTIWETDADLGYALYRERAELEYLNSEFETAERFVNEAIAREQDVFRRADLYYMLIVQATLRAQYERAVETARLALALFGEQLPERDFEQARDTELAAVGVLMRGRSLAELAELPPMTDPRAKAVMQVLTTLGPPCYRALPQLWSVIVARQIRMCLEYGAVPAAAYSYPAFGGLLTHVQRGDGADCATLYQATVRLMDRRPDPAFGSVGYLMMGSSLRHWFSPLKEACQDYLDAYRIGQATGNLQYAVYGFGHNTYCRYFQGDALDEMIPEALGYLDYSRQRRNLWGIDLITGALRVFQLLHGPWQQATWAHQEETEESFLARCERHGNIQVLCIYHIMRAAALLQTGDTASAAFSIREAEKRLDSVSVQGLLPVTQFHLLKALVAVDAPASLGMGANEARRNLAQAEERYRRWRRHAPDNFDHWHALLIAEHAALQGDVDTLIEAYDGALQAAQQQSCWPAVALIAGRAERYWQRRGQKAFADVYRQQAQQALRRWRAWAVVESAEQTADAGSDSPAAPQMSAVIQIAQALSLHTELDQLVPEIIRNVAQQTGAQRVVLLLARDEDLHVAMESGVKDSRYYDAPPRLDSMDTLPRSVIRYVARTQDTLRFSDSDIQNTMLLNNDPYLHERSRDRGGFRGTVWCVPLSYLGQMLGVLYMEHGLATDAFDERQGPLVEFLAAQAAISVRNIELIKRLAEEARARREAELRMQTADEEILVRREMEEKLKKLANTDELTELPNRRMFIESLKQAWSRREEVSPPALIMLDIDHFKHINDQFGHATGDEVLRHLARLFRGTFRAFDLAARIGGEEFAVLLRDTGDATVLDIAQRVCRHVAKSPVRVNGRVIPFTVSIGIARIHPDDPSHENVLHRADQALYHAKADGRNRVRRFGAPQGEIE